ncbi:hypothetical protein [Pedobacter jeongneungensis]|uniref:hypothetical protein n=1 Tax=Pedobacter jeongneungensis TaxID=947309 RepID=UPI000469DC4E|nr:hypothetical protein [Pedobacter jeongneungensis]
MKKFFLALPFIFSLPAVAAVTLESPILTKGTDCTMSYTSSATSFLICANGERMSTTVTITSTATAGDCETAKTIAAVISSLKADAVSKQAMPIMAAACDPKPHGEELPVILLGGDEPAIPGDDAPIPVPVPVQP